MQFEFSLYSLEHIKLRGISKELVELVLDYPDEIANEFENQIIYQKVIENYLYRVFVNSNKNPSLIKTVYKTSKINKYQ